MNETIPLLDNSENDEIVNRIVKDILQYLYQNAYQKTYIDFHKENSTVCVGFKTTDPIKIKKIIDQLLSTINNNKTKISIKIVFDKEKYEWPLLYIEYIKEKKIEKVKNVEYFTHINEFNSQVAAYLFYWYILPEYKKNKKNIKSDDLILIKYDYKMVKNIINFICKTHHLDRDKRVISNILDPQEGINTFYRDPNNLPKFSKTNTIENYFDQERMLITLNILMTLLNPKSKIERTFWSINFYL